MIGIQFLKAPATTYVMQLKNGKVVRSGPGLSFFYFAPTSVIVQIPISTINVPFVFNEITQDFQEVSVQGDLTFRVNDPQRLAELMDFSTNRHGQFLSEDPAKLNDRMIHAAQVRARSYLQGQPLRKALISSDELVKSMLDGLDQSSSLKRLGVDVLDIVILEISANPEMAKALQAEAREKLLRQADEAIYARRNTSVELERSIRENELQTEMLVQQKRRQIRETDLATEVALEEQRKSLVASRVENERLESQARAENLKAILEPIQSIDWRTLVAANGSLDSATLISMGFEELSRNAAKIGELNISPDLLSTLLKSKRESRG